MLKKRKKLKKLINYTNTWKDDTVIHYDDRETWDDGYWVFHEFYIRIMELE